ncbi:uncharacterized protein Z518_03362 [Rhinocladiella mackenziei CBS 650.93]|uniref:Uncharacterized protein n=1 Tax=Rhinocladiella mackenziei CBS 650.93 TaxID=1442369 RepID=A0A0D2JH64_9EURO|nr:uncharacterized protein Z518_03362 [Rhinocladiella mackenziei CBS 650.93]KIX08705.1 hypothetical protein Z518_03362 [Rhinocladiella mackenziei CBS 650.93]
MDVLVGPGCLKAFLPSWPANRKQYETASALYEGRRTTELDFSHGNPKVSSFGGFPAHDYFSGGSFYVLSTSGHTIGACTHDLQERRVDVYIHGWRYCSLTCRLQAHFEISPSSHSKWPTIHVYYLSSKHIVQMHHLYSKPEGQTLSRTTPFSRVAGPEHDLAESQRSANRLTNFDDEGNILTVLAHDASLQDVLEFFPRKANDWKEKGWKKEGHWRWLAPRLQSCGPSKL